MTTPTSSRKLSATVACALGERDLASQRERWIALRERAGAGRIETEDGLRLVFAHEPGVEEELRALTAVENECCSWASWTVTRSGASWFMDAASRGDGIAALQGMFVDGGIATRPTAEP